MRTALLLSFVCICLVSQTSCGLVAHQVHRASNLIMSPFRRAELDQRFLDGKEELERTATVSVHA